MTDEPPPSPAAVASYVAAAAPLLGLDLDPGRIAAVTEAFALLCRVAAPAWAFALDPAAEPAPVFRPAGATEDAA